MGTRIYAQIWHQDSVKAQQLLQSVMDEMERINQLMSPYIPASEVAQINQASPLKPIVISSELFLVIQQANEFSELTNGAFDITFASLGYQFDYRNKVKPEESLRKAATELINYQGLKLNKANRSVVISKQGMRIDLGGIAKGYVVDNCIRLLKQAGVKHAIVTAGGDSRLIGDRRGRPWMLGIKHPRGDKHVITLPLESVAISTSGDYERFFEEDGVRYHHIIDPSKGKSAKQVISTTILADNSIEADALSTSIFVMGVDKGLDLVNSLSGISAILIDKRGKVHYSSDLADPTMQKP